MDASAVIPRIIANQRLLGNVFGAWHTSARYGRTRGVCRSTKADKRRTCPNVRLRPEASAVTVARNCRRVRNCALSVRADNLHSTEAAAAVPSVKDRYQCQAETQSRGGRQGEKKSMAMLMFGRC